MLGAISISTQVTRNPLPSYLQEITELWKGIFQVNFDNTDSFTFEEVMPGFCIRLLSFCQKPLAQKFHKLFIQLCYDMAVQEQLPLK